MTWAIPSSFVVSVNILHCGNKRQSKIAFLSTNFFLRTLASLGRRDHPGQLHARLQKAVRGIARPSLSFTAQGYFRAPMSSTTL